ncbi:MAG TPA: hypothetical protein VN699_07560, partial [Pirellulales bacterium]|nr:hypothetical protein [Pirellulales bacterium]
MTSSGNPNAKPDSVGDSGDSTAKPAEQGSPAPVSDDAVDEGGVLSEIGGPAAAAPTLPKRVKTLLVGKPRDLKDES